MPTEFEISNNNNGYKDNNNNDDKYNNNNANPKKRKKNSVPQDNNVKKPNKRKKQKKRKVEVSFEDRLKLAQIEPEEFESMKMELEKLGYNEENAQTLILRQKYEPAFIQLVKLHGQLITIFTHDQLIEIAAQRDGANNLDAVNRLYVKLRENPYNLTIEQIVQIVSRQNGYKNLDCVIELYSTLEQEYGFNKEQIVEMASSWDGANNLKSVIANYIKLTSSCNFINEEIVIMVKFSGSRNLKSVVKYYDLLNEFTHHQIVKMAQHYDGFRNIKAVKKYFPSPLSRIFKHDHIVSLVGHPRGSRNLKKLSERYDEIESFNPDEIVSRIGKRKGWKGIDKMIKELSSADTSKQSSSTITTSTTTSNSTSNSTSTSNTISNNNNDIDDYGVLKDSLKKRLDDAKITVDVYNKRKKELKKLGYSDDQAENIISKTSKNGFAKLLQYHQRLFPTFDHVQLTRITSNAGGPKNLKSVKKHHAKLMKKPYNLNKDQIVQIVSWGGGSENLKSFKKLHAKLRKEPYNLNTDQIVGMVSWAGGWKNLEGFIEHYSKLVGDGYGFTTEEIVKMVSRGGGLNNLISVSNHYSELADENHGFNKRQIIKILSNGGGSQGLITVVKNYDQLKDRFSNDQIVKMAKWYGGSGNLNFVIANYQFFINNKFTPDDIVRLASHIAAHKTLKMIVAKWDQLKHYPRADIVNRIDASGGQRGWNKIEKIDKMIDEVNRWELAVSIIENQELMEQSKEENLKKALIQLNYTKEQATELLKGPFEIVQPAIDFLIRRHLDLISTFSHHQLITIGAWGRNYLEAVNDYYSALQKLGFNTNHIVQMVAKVDGPKNLQTVVENYDQSGSLSHRKIEAIVEKVSKDYGWKAISNEDADSEVEETMIVTETNSPEDEISQVEDAMFVSALEDELKEQEERKSLKEGLINLNFTESQAEQILKDSLWIVKLKIKLMILNEGLISTFNRDQLSTIADGDEGFNKLHTLNDYYRDLMHLGFNANHIVHMVKVDGLKKVFEKYSDLKSLSPEEIEQIVQKVSKDYGWKDISTSEQDVDVEDAMIVAETNSSEPKNARVTDEPNSSQTPVKILSTSQIPSSLFSFLPLPKTTVMQIETLRKDHDELIGPPSKK